MPTGGAAEYQNKDFGFLGDLDGMFSPQPMLISKEKSWKFEEKKVEMDRMKFSEHYKNAKGDDVKKMWDPADRTMTINATASKMFLIPHTTSPRMPWELYSHIADMIAAEESPCTDEDWEFILN